jgi:hypothetical protein
MTLQVGIHHETASGTSLLQAGQGDTEFHVPAGSPSLTSRRVCVNVKLIRISHFRWGTDRQTETETEGER